MRLSTVFELLVIALLIAFAASRVIDGPDRSKTLADSGHRFSLRKDRQTPEPTPVEPPTRYCSCSSLTCNCCRDFSLPVVPIKGPGCATVSFLRDDAMMITMSFGERVLRNITVNTKKPKPICMGMPGGISKFCGRLYSIKRDGENFKACLALELRALDDVEAALRVSCFKFGPNGVNVVPGEAVPAEKNKEDEDEDDDDDDYGLGELDDDDDDDDDDFGLTGGEDDDDEDERPPAKDTNYNDVDSSDSDADDDYTGLSSLSEELFGGFFGSSGSNRRPGVSDDDDDDDDDDDEEEEDYVAKPPRTQAQPQVLPQPQQPSSQVNLVVMQPVILPTQTLKPSASAVQKRPIKKPGKLESTSTSPVKRVRPTSPTPLKTEQTTNNPVKTLGTSTTPALSQAESTTPKAPAKKKKKPVRTRRPATPKPTSTEVPSSIVTASTMTVNVVQGDVHLNETKPHKSPKPIKDSVLKIPMSKPVVEAKPLENSSTKNSYTNEDITINGGTDKVNTEINEVTTQTIMQNTIPIDETMDDGLHAMNSQRISNRKPIEPQNDEGLVEDLKQMSVTPVSANTAEGTTNQETTEREESFTNDNMDNPDKDSVQFGSETTAKYSEESGIEETETTILDNMKGLHSVNFATEPYDIMNEGTDRTEALKENVNYQQDTESSSNEENENDEEDDDEEIDIGADLGLEDDDEEDDEERDENKKHASNYKKKEKDEYDDGEVIDAILGQDDDDESKTEEKEEERNIGRNSQYQINPLLYRLARISSGSVATARHLPRFSEGRNRRNNKRMRFPPLEVAS